ncbi:MAG TPA: nitroreductase family protein [Bacteroidia bacterium]|nr:nitroreductase family protein [Bacteroidia bacterium]
MSYPYIPYSIPEINAEEMIQKSKEFFQWMNMRRTVRDFSDRVVPVEAIENCIRTASTAPSGAHKQPWTFCLISNTEIKKQIRRAAEEEEYKSYHGRMTTEWLEDLAPLGTNWEKPFLEKAPWIIVVFKRVYEIKEGQQRNNYYVQESVGLACGFLLMALYNAGLVALTHTPSPMNFLSTLLDRPANERPFLLIPVGYPASNATVPDLKRKSLDEVLVRFR